MHKNRIAALNNTAEQSSTDLTSTHRQPAPPGEEWGVGRARVEGHIAIYESVKVILVVGVALSLSFSSPLPPLASHSFVARRSSRSLSSSSSSSTSIWPSSKPSSSSSPSPRSSLVARRSSRSSSSSSLSSFIRYRQIDYPQPLLRHGTTWGRW